VALLAVAGPGPVAGQAPPAQAADNQSAMLRQKLTAEIRRLVDGHDGVMGVAIRDLTTGDDVAVNADLVFPTGSSIKIPILVELHKQVAEGRRRLTDQARVTDATRVGGAGVLAHFGQASALSLEDVAVLMITLSDNTATNMLIDTLGSAEINRTLDAQGLSQIRLRRRMIDQAASARGDENTATPREAQRLMEKLFRGELVSRAVSDAVLATLKLPKSSPLPRLLPPSTVIANKPGGIEGASCDWGLVYIPNRPYAIAVMSTYNGEGADDAIARISRLAYDYFARMARSTKYGARVPVELLPK
jgi:beta-lactamase class A